MKIAQFRMIELAEKVKKFNNKAKKLNLPLIEVKEVSREVREFKRKDEVLGSYIEYMEFVEVEFIGAIPRVGGWAIHSKIEPAAQVEGNFVYTNKGFEPREDLRTTKMVCQHCNINRFRSVVYLLENLDTKEQKLVGKSCLKDFLPETNIAEVLAYLQRFEDLSSGEGSDDDEEYERAPREAFVYPVDMLIAESLILIEKFGYMSKKAAQEKNERATDSEHYESTSSMLAESSEKTRKALYPEEKIAEIFKSGKVQLVLDYLNAQDSSKDFIYNVQLAIKQAVAPYKMFAFIAAGVNMYWKSVSEAAEKVVSDKVNEYIGVVGERIDFNDLRIVREYVSQGNYGSTYITTMEDPKGRSVVWFASKRVGDIGTVVNLKGTIREHKEFKDVKQTVITRATKV